jgi:hypothetical protein
MATYLERYLAGEQARVWREIVALGEAVRDEPALSETQSVAREMMGRVRRNIERLIPRLRERNYAFANAEPLSAPDENVVGYLAVMEEWGPLPLALRVFWEVVGEVCLDGSFSGGDMGLGEAQFPLSPLTVAGPLASFDNWMEAYEEEEPVGYLNVCYDPSHVLGAFTLPGPCWPADTELLMAQQDVLPGPFGPMLFVEYLRLSLEYGGFPSCAYGQPEKRIIETLTEGFESF